MIVVFTLFSCVRELPPLSLLSEDKEEEKRVKIEFTLPGTMPGTKALADIGALNSLHLAVFGGSGYLQEYVNAEFIANHNQDTIYKVPKADNPLDSVWIHESVPHYTFQAILKMSNNPRTVHLIGNGPSVLSFGYDSSILPRLMSGVNGAGDMCYWQMISLPDGIRARTINGQYVDAYGQPIPDNVNDRFVPDDATAAAFVGIPLIRNWAKLEVVDAENSNFQTISFTVINVPQRGTIVPYYSPRETGETGFISNYQDLSWSQLSNIPYLGNLPVGTPFNTVIPEAKNFDPTDADYVPTDANNAALSGSAVYLYERPAPSEFIQPSYVIVYGYYDNPEDQESKGYCYYKVDLMETKKDSEGRWTSSYYPIFRNFKYQVVIKKVLSQGCSTPADAAASAGSADVSADINALDLSDISDGVGRLHISPWLAHTFSEGAVYDEDDPFTDLNVYFGDVEGNPYMDLADVTVELLTPEDGGENFINGLSIGAPAPETASNYGWRGISFWFEAQETERTQTIRVTGHYGDDGRTIYRDVVITVQPLQSMNVSCEYPDLPPERGQRQSLIIEIPDGLVKSIFPLDFTIEAEEMTLSPDNSFSNNNLPVVSGVSLSGSQRPAFQFVRTMTWDDYCALRIHEDAHEVRWRSDTCHFVTTREDNASKIYVYNEYFRPAVTEFKNSMFKHFQNLGFQEAIKREAGQPLTLSFNFESPGSDPYPTYVEIKIAGLSFTRELNPDLDFQTGESAGSYIVFTDTDNPQDFELHFLSENEDAIFSVDLDAYGYYHAHVEPYIFPLAAFVDAHPLSNGYDNWQGNTWSNVVLGHVNQDNNKTVLFAYKDHPDKANTPITITPIGGLQLSFSMVTPSGLTSLTKGDGNSYSITPTAPRSSTSENTYHEIEMRSSGGTGTIWLILSSPGYISKTIEAPRFKGNIFTWNNIGLGFRNNNIDGYGVLKYEPTSTTDGKKCRVTIENFVLSNNRIFITRGTTCKVTIEQAPYHANKGFFYLDLFFYRDSKGNVIAPKSISANFGTVTKYPGDNRQYIWSTSEFRTDPVVLEITAPEDQDVEMYQMYAKTYNSTASSSSGLDF